MGSSVFKERLQESPHFKVQQERKLLCPEESEPSASFPQTLGLLLAAVPLDPEGP